MSSGNGLNKECTLEWSVNTDPNLESTLSAILSDTQNFKHESINDLKHLKTNETMKKEKNKSDIIPFQEM